MRGSSSFEKSGKSGKGNNISDTPVKVKAAPIPNKPLDKAPPVIPAFVKAIEPGTAKASPIKATPSKVLPKPPPAPLITGTILILDLPIGS